MPSASVTETFNCTPAEFYKIISDYEKYPEFLNEVKACKVVSAEAGRKLVEFKVSVIKSFTYKMWMTEKPAESIDWDFAGGDVFKTSTGSWKLSAEGERTKGTYSVDATFGLFVPGPIAKTLLSVNLPSMMNAYKERVRKLYGK